MGGDGESDDGRVFLDLAVEGPGQFGDWVGWDVVVWVEFLFACDEGVDVSEGSDEVVSELEQFCLHVGMIARWQHLPAALQLPAVLPAVFALVGAWMRGDPGKLAVDLVDLPLIGVRKELFLYPS